MRHFLQILLTIVLHTSPRTSSIHEFFRNLFRNSLFSSTYVDFYPAMTSRTCFRNKFYHMFFLSFWEPILAHSSPYFATLRSIPRSDHRLAFHPSRPTLVLTSAYRSYPPFGRLSSCNVN